MIRGPFLDGSHIHNEGEDDGDDDNSSMKAQRSDSEPMSPPMNPADLDVDDDLVNNNENDNDDYSDMLERGRHARGSMIPGDMDFIHQIPPQPMDDDDEDGLVVAELPAPADEAASTSLG